MITRAAKKEDIGRLKELWKQGFGDSDGFIDWYFRARFPKGGASVSEEDGRIVSMAFFQPMRMRLRSATVDAAMLNGVYTLPEYRKRGLMHENVLFLEREAAALGIPAMINTPAGKNHYHGLGHRYIASCERRTLLPEGDGAVSLLENDITAHARQTLLAYEAMSARYSGMIVRDIDAQRERLDDYASDGAYMIRLKRGEATAAYAVLYELSERFLCPECVYTDDAAREELLTLLKRLGRPCEVKLPGSAPTAVGAVLDAARLLRRFDLPFSMEVRDDILPENCGVFSLDGKPHPPVCAIDAARLMPLLIGSCGLCEKNGIIVYDEKGAEELNALLPERQCFMIEEY